MACIELMALRHSAFYTPYLLTMAGGFLQKQGLEYRYRVASPKDSVDQNFAAGSCHVAQSAVATSFKSLGDGQNTNVVHFAQINERDGFFLASREPLTAFSWDDLRGKQVLVDHFFQPKAMLNYALHLAGMDFSAFELIDAGDVNAMDQAFRHGQGDFIHQQGPAPQQMAFEGKAQVVVSVGESIGPVAFSSLCARRDWLETDMAHQFTAAYADALQFCAQNKAEVLAQCLQQADFLTEIHPQVLTATIEAYKALGCWQTSLEISPGAFEKLLDVFIHDGYITQRFDYDTVIVAPPGI